MICGSQLSLPNPQKVMIMTDRLEHKLLCDLSLATANLLIAIDKERLKNDNIIEFASIIEDMVKVGEAMKKLNEYRGDDNG